MPSIAGWPEPTVYMGGGEVPNTHRPGVDSNNIARRGGAHSCLLGPIRRQVGADRLR